MDQGKMKSRTADVFLDSRGLHGPLPVLKIKKVLSGLAGGAVLHVEATDAEAEGDVVAFSERHGHRILEMHKGTDGVLTFFIERGAPTL